MTVKPSALAMRDYFASVYRPAIEADIDAYLAVSSIENGTWFTRTFDIHRIIDAAQWLAEVNETKDVYYRVALLGEPLQSHWQRGRADQTRFVTHFVCDVDYGMNGHSSTQLVSTIDEAIAIIEQTLTPTSITSSGGGVYGIYELSELVDVSATNYRTHDAYRMGLRLDDALNQHGVADRVNNFANVIRPVGSISHKRPGEPRPVVTLKSPSRVRYTMQQLDLMLPKLSPNQLKKTDTTNHVTTPIGEIFNNRVEWHEILEADEQNQWRDNGDGTWWRGGNGGKQSIELIGERVKVRSSTLASQWGISGGTHLDKFGLACLILGHHPSQWRRYTK